jgi:hypothetical protein
MWKQHVALTLSFLHPRFPVFLSRTDHMHIPVAEVAVAWHEVDGSKLIRNKLDVVFTSLRMARDMACMRIAYSIDLWKPVYLR